MKDMSIWGALEKCGKKGWVHQEPHKCGKKEVWPTWATSVTPCRPHLSCHCTPNNRLSPGPTYSLPFCPTDLHTSMHSEHCRPQQTADPSTTPSLDGRASPIWLGLAFHLNLTSSSPAFFAAQSEHGAGPTWVIPKITLPAAATLQGPGDFPTLPLLRDFKVKPAQAHSRHMAGSMLSAPRRWNSGQGCDSPHTRGHGCQQPPGAAPGRKGTDAQTHRKGAGSPRQATPADKGQASANRHRGREACTTPADKENRRGRGLASPPRHAPFPSARLPQARCPAGNILSRHLPLRKDKSLSSRQ